MKMNCKRLSGCEFLESKTDLCTRTDYPCKNCYCVCKKYIQLCNERGEVPKKNFTYTEAMEEVCLMQQEIINELRFAGKTVVKQTLLECLKDYFMSAKQALTSKIRSQAFGS